MIQAIQALIRSVQAIVRSVRVEAPERDLLRHRPAGAAHSGRQPLVLLVAEDLPDYARAMAETVFRHHADAAVDAYLAHSFGAALALCGTLAVDLALVDADLQDPEGDGAELVRRMRAARPDLPILAASGSKRSNARLLAAGATAAVGKERARLAAWLVAHAPLTTPPAGDVGFSR